MALDFEFCCAVLVIICGVSCVFTGMIIGIYGYIAERFYHEYGTLLTANFNFLTILLMIVGTAITVFAILAGLELLSGHFSYNQILLIVLQLIALCFGLLLMSETGDHLRDTLFDTIKFYDQKYHHEITILWNNIQRHFDCCGVDNSNDWHNILNSTHSLPHSCCTFPDETPGVTSCYTNSTTLHQDGCLVEFSNHINGFAVSVQIVSIVPAVIQIIAMVWSHWI